MQNNGGLLSLVFFMGGRGMHILGEEKHHLSSNIDLRSADVSAPHM